MISSCAAGGTGWLVIERFWLLAKKLRDAGIAHIPGDVIIDDTLFNRGAIETPAIDGKATRTYNTSPNALLINFGATVITVDAEPQSAASLWIRRQQR